MLHLRITSEYCHSSRARRQVASAQTNSRMPKDVPCSSNQLNSSLPRDASSSEKCNDSSNVTKSSTTSHDDSTKQKSTVKLLKKLAVVWGLFMCCWLPVALATSVDYTGHVKPGMLRIAFVLAQCNSAVNVFIYGALSKDIRTAWRRTLSCKRE